jgi:predicted MFS family arabinose efflux permease
MNQNNDKILTGLAATAFITFFGGYMIAPLIPTLTREFSTNEHHMGWVVPAFMLPYGFSTLIYGTLSDRFGRRKILLILLAVALFTTFLVSLSWSANSLIGMRILAGLSSGGIVTIALTLVADLFPYEKLGRAMGWMFGGIAGGMAFGSTFGAWLNPYIGWRNEFALLAVKYILEPSEPPLRNTMLAQKGHLL